MIPILTIQKVIQDNPHILTPTLSKDQEAKIILSFDPSSSDEDDATPSSTTSSLSSLWDKKTELLSAAEPDLEQITSHFKTIYSTAFTVEEKELLTNHHDLIVQLHLFPSALKKAKGVLLDIPNKHKSELFKHPNCLLALDLQQLGPTFTLDHLATLLEKFPSVPEINLSYNTQLNWSEALPKLATLKNLIHLNLSFCFVQDFTPLFDSQIEHLIVDISAKPALSKKTATSKLPKFKSISYQD